MIPEKARSGGPKPGAQRAAPTSFLGRSMRMQSSLFSLLPKAGSEGDVVTVSLKENRKIPERGGLVNTGGGHRKHHLLSVD